MPVPSNVTVTGEIAIKPLSDPNLMLYGLICLAGADGTIDVTETATLNGFVQQLPEFRGRDHNQVFADAFALRRKYTVNGQPNVELLRGLSTPLLKRKLYVLAVDLAMASGSIDQSEALLLQQFQSVLGIEAQLAARIFDVLSMKYAT